MINDVVTNFFMFIYQIELLTYIDTINTRYLLINRHNYDLGLNQGDEVYIRGAFSDESTALRAIVIEIKNEIYAPDSSLETYGEEAVRNGLFVRRIFIEAEDRDAVLNFSQRIRELNPQMFNR